MLLCQIGRKVKKIQELNLKAPFLFAAALEDREILSDSIEQATEPVMAFLPPKINSVCCISFSGIYGRYRHPAFL